MANPLVQGLIDHRQEAKSGVGIGKLQRHEQVIAEHVLILGFPDRGPEMEPLGLMIAAREIVGGVSSEFLFVPAVEKDLKPVLGNNLNVELGHIVGQKSIVGHAIEVIGLDVLDTIGTPQPEFILEDRSAKVKPVVFDAPNDVGARDSQARKLARGVGSLESGVGDIKSVRPD